MAVIDLSVDFQNELFRDCNFLLICDIEDSKTKLKIDPTKVKSGIAIECCHKVIDGHLEVKTFNLVIRIVGKGKRVFDGLIVDIEPS